MGFLSKLFGGGNNKDSAKIAKDRLQIVLMHDRRDISPQLLDNLREEIVSVLTKYMDIDKTKIEIDLDHERETTALIANIPVLKIKRGGSIEID
ncbi:MAG: cell division topological specificity factor MinE [Synergistaceae bacterium]|nr:cell division topological specificity factor MinE [Synergistaceae bacterium]